MKVRALLVIAAIVVGLFVLGAILVPVLSRDDTSRVGLDRAVRRVEVSSERGGVSVSPGPAAVETRRRYILSAPTVRTSLAAGVLRVEVTCPGWAFASCSADVRVTAPASAEVDVDAVRGDVRVTGMAAPVRAVSEDGDVAVSGPGSAMVEARSVTGAVEAVLTTPALRLVARSETAGVRVTVPAGAYRLDVTSERGAVTVGEGIRRAPGAARRIEAHSGIGDVTVTAG